MKIVDRYLFINKSIYSRFSHFKRNFHEIDLKKSRFICSLTNIKRYFRYLKVPYLNDWILNAISNKKDGES